MDTPRSTPARRIAGRNVFLSLLADEGIDLLFGNPGTTELAIMDALAEQDAIRYVLGLQESLVVAMADGYARASGRLAAANVHVAPGLGNAMGSLYNAKFSGSPVLLTAGQHEQGHGLMEPLLYDPLVPIAQPMVKWATEVTRLADLPRVVRRAAKVALTPPTGPVFISLPGDILDDEADGLDLGRASRVDSVTRPTDAALIALADRLLAAHNPILIAGHELSTRDALQEAARVAELLGAGVRQQSVPYTAQFPSEHPAYLGPLTRNQGQVRQWLDPHDLIAFLGGDQLRMSVASAADPMPAGRFVVQIGERDWELAKNYPADIAIKADVKETLRALAQVLIARRTPQQAERAAVRLAGLARDNWSVQRARAAAQLDGGARVEPMDPRFLMLRLSDAVGPDTVVVEEGLTSTFSLLNFLRLRDAHGYYGLASGGIGFALPGAIGISLAQPARPVLAIVGDGSAMYSIQALWTAAHLRRPITYVIANNRSYRILKERQMARRGNDTFFGMDMRDPPIDFVALARSMGVPAQRVDRPDDVAAAVQQGLRSGTANLIDVRVADGFGG